MLIGEILIENGKLSAEDLASALDKQKQYPGKRLGDILCADGIVAEWDILEALGRQFGIEVCRELPAGAIDSLLVEKLPVEWARTQKILPVRINDRIAALCCDPSMIDAFNDLELLLGEEVYPVLVESQLIVKAIEQCYFNRDSTTQELIDSFNADSTGVNEDATSDDLLRVVDNAPVTQLVNAILLEALKSGASDVHIEPFEKKVIVRYRIDGFLYEQSSPPKHLELALISRLKVMSRLDIAERRMPQDGTARVRVGDKEIDIRVSTVPVAEGERLVLRLLNRSAALLPLCDLGMEAEMLQQLRALLQTPNGVILVTGPTGSGKTTTLYAALQELDTRHLNVLTIEDPIEYQLPDIGQIQVKPKIGLTFAQGLRHILRQDPDVILVGETRDLETAEIVVRSSLTGHLVFSTLHTNDAAGAVVRMVDMGVEPYLLASAVRAVLAQRLVRCLCDACKEAYTIKKEHVEQVDMLQSLIGKTAWRAKGCDACRGGYRGRTGIYELLVVNPIIQQAIRRNADSSELKRLAFDHGMQLLAQDGIAKVLSGVTTLDEVIRTTGHDEAV